MIIFFIWAMKDFFKTKFLVNLEDSNSRKKKKSNISSYKKLKFYSKLNTGDLLIIIQKRYKAKKNIRLMRHTSWLLNKLVVRCCYLFHTTTILNFFEKSDLFFFKSSPLVILSHFRVYVMERDVSYILYTIN